MDAWRSDAAVAVLDGDAAPLACSAKLKELLGRGEDWRERLGRVLSGEAAPALAAGRAWRGSLFLPGGRSVAATCERLDGLWLLWLVDSDRERDPLGAEAWGRLSECLAHDARNPLNALVIHLELLGSRLAASPGAQSVAERHLVAIREQVGRVDGLLQRFLRFASPRPESADRVDLADLLRRAVEFCCHDARRHGVTVGTRLQAAEVPAGPPGLAQAVLQLVMQGIDAGRPSGDLRLGVGPREGEAVLSLEVVPSSGACWAPSTATFAGVLALPAAARIAELQGGRVRPLAEAGRVGLELVVPLASGQG